MFKFRVIMLTLIHQPESRQNLDMIPRRVTRDCTREESTRTCLSQCHHVDFNQQKTRKDLVL